MARPRSVTNPLLFSLGFGYRWKSEPDLLLIYGPAWFTEARGVHGKGWASAGTVRLCDADELDAREARTFARTLLPYPRPLDSRASHMSAAVFCLERCCCCCCCCCCWRKALVPWTGNFLSFVFSCIPLLVSFCLVDWRPFALSLLLLYIVLDAMRCSVVICYFLLFSVGIFDFVSGLHLSLLKVLWFFFFGIILCDLF